MKHHIVLMTLALTAGSAMAKLPPVSDEAKAKAAEAAAKTAWSDKVAGYQLCQSQDRVAAAYLAQARAAGKSVQPATTPACAGTSHSSHEASLSIMCGPWCRAMSITPLLTTSGPAPPP